MKFYYDSLSYNNVVSKRYLVNYDLVESAEKDFLTGLSKVGYKIKGPLTNEKNIKFYGPMNDEKITFTGP